MIADYAFERPVVTPASAQTMARLDASQGAGRVWTVGAYSRFSMPLLENGVKSAMEVARALGVDTSDVEVDEAKLAAAAAAAERSQRSLSLAALAAALVTLTVARVAMRA